jgi:FSR family fosmidomycin resistance protein-like MFS transporter
VISVFLPLFGEAVLGLSLSQVGIILSANLMATAVFQPLFGHLADRSSRRALVICGSTLQGVAMFLMPLLDGFTDALLLNILMGLAGAVSLPAASGMIVTEGKKGGMGGAMAIFNIGMSLGLTVGPIWAAASLT